jgi:hypothetical protein
MPESFELGNTSSLDKLAFTSCSESRVSFWYIVVDTAKDGKYHV